MKLLFLLLIVFQFKHLLSDYFLQGEYMLGKFKPNWAFLFPLLAHVGVHAAMTFAIAMFLVSWKLSILLALGDASIHFAMDRIKAGPKYMGRWKPLTAQEWIASRNIITTYYGPHYETTIKQAKARLRGNRLFWISLGWDQMIHHLTHYGIIYFIILFHK